MCTSCTCMPNIVEQLSEHYRQVNRKRDRQTMREVKQMSHKQDGGKAGATKSKAWRATAERVTHPASTLQSILAPLRWEARLRNLVEREHVPL